MQNEAVFQKSAWKAIFSLSIPSLISIVVMMLYNMADMYFVGWLGDYTQVAAVSLAMPVYSILMAVSTMIGNGGCTKIAQALGQCDEQRVRCCSALCVWSSIAFGILFAVFCFLFCTPLLTFLGANEEMSGYTRSYLLILTAGAPAILLNHSIGGALRGEGEIKAGMLGGMLATIANIILDPLFIIVFRLGVGGAALATVLGNVIAVIYYFLYKTKSRTNCIIEIRPAYAHDLKALGSILSLGLPNAISSILSGFAGTFSNRILVGYGTAAVAAMAAAGKSIMVVTMVQMGICMGIAPLLAYCYGAKDYGRLKEVLQKVLFLTVGLGTALTIVIFFGREWVIGLFIKDASVISLGAYLVTFQIITGPFIGIYYLATNFLQATGNAPGASVASALRQGLLLIPLLYLLSGLFGLEGLAMAHPAADSISVLITSALAIYYYRKIV